MSKLEVKEITPISGETDLTLGQSGGTVTLADGATAIGFGPEAPEYPIGQVRAWVRFNGTGTVSIYGSLNVSSITDNGVGSYTVNLETPMPDSKYSTFCGSSTGNSRTGASVRSVAAGSYHITCDSSATLTDLDQISTGVVG